MISHLPLVPVLVTLVASILIPLAGRFHRAAGWTIAIVASGLSFSASVVLLLKVREVGRISYWLGNWEPPWGIEYAVDYLNSFVLVIVSFMAVIVTVYSRKSVPHEIPEEKVSTFYALLMLLLTGLLGIVVTGDIFNLYVFLEISAISGYVLVAAGKRREALMASYHYLILGTIGATFILLGIGYLYMATGSLNMADLRTRLPELYQSKVVLTAFAFFTVGLSIKLALFPFHTWLPNAYTYAPSVASAFMAATVTKVSAYALIRIMYTVFTPTFDRNIVEVTELLLVLAAVAMIVGPVMAIAQTDIRRMLAYSSVGQIGYIVMGISLGSHAAMVGGLTHLFNHALMKGGLFLVVGVLVYKTGITKITELRGLGRRFPITMAAFTIFALSMIGVPLTVGFVSKWYLAVGAIDAGVWFAIPVIMVSSLLTAIYFWRVIEEVYFKAPAPSTRHRFQEDVPMSMLGPTVVLAVLCVVFGVLAFIPVSMTELIATMLLTPTGH